MATGTFHFFGNGRKFLTNGALDLDTNTFNVSLHTASYSPNKDTHDYFDDVTNEVSGTGYTAGGQALSSKTLTLTAANSWATTWASATAYKVGDLIRPTSGNGFLYTCVTAGTSGGSQPTWPTVVGTTVTDNTAVWMCFGTNVVTFDSADPTWAASTITNARYAVLRKANGGSASADELLGYLDFGGNVSSSDGSLTITVHAAGWFYY